MLYTQFLFCTCFPGVMLVVLLWVLRLAFSVWWYSALSASGDLHQGEYDVDGLFFFHSWKHLKLFLFANTFLHLFFLHSSSTLHTNLIYVVLVLYIRSLLSLLLLKALFAQFHVCVSLTVSELFIAVRSLVLSMCPVSLLSIPRQYYSLLHPVSPLRNASAIIPDLCFSTQCHCFSHKYIILPRTTAFYYYLYKTMVVTNRGNRNKAN